MASKDLYHNIAIGHLMDAQDITNHTDVASKYVDTVNAESATVLVNYGTVTNTDANNKVVAKLQSATTAPNLNASWADVDAADMMGAFTIVDGASDDNTTQVVGYKGAARYLRVLLDFTSAGANPDHCPVSVDAILGFERHNPPTAPTTGTSNS